MIYQNTDFIDFLSLNKIMKVLLLKNQNIVHILANSSEIFLSFTISSFKHFFTGRNYLPLLSSSSIDKYKKSLFSYFASCKLNYYEDNRHGIQEC